MVQRNLYVEISKAKWCVILYGKCGLSFLIIHVHEEKSYRVSPNVASNFFEPISQTTCRIQQIARTKGLSLNNNEQRRRCKIDPKTLYSDIGRTTNLRMRMQSD